MTMSDVDNLTILRLTLKKYNLENYHIEMDDNKGSTKEIEIICDCEFLDDYLESEENRLRTKIECKAIDLCKTMIEMSKTNIKANQMTSKCSEKQIIKLKSNNVTKYLIWICENNNFKFFVHSNVSYGTFSTYGKLLGPKNFN